VHAHDWIVNSALHAVRRAQLPLVVILHDYGHRCATKRLVRREPECEGSSVRRCLTCSAAYYGPIGPSIAAANAVSAGRRAPVTAFIAVSNATADGNGLSSSGVRHHVIPSFVPDDLVESPVNQKREVDPDAPLVHVGDVTATGVPMSCLPPIGAFLTRRR
jgi:hypothetical protein